jgi:hypothetical protein
MFRFVQFLSLLLHNSTTIGDGDDDDESISSFFKEVYERARVAKWQKLE